MSKPQLSRRVFVAGSSIFVAGILAGCSRTTKRMDIEASGTQSPFATMYGPMPKERFPLPGINLKQVPEKFLRQVVSYRTDEKVGTLIVDTK